MQDWIGEKDPFSHHFPQEILHVQLLLILVGGNGSSINADSSLGRAICHSQTQFQELEKMAAKFYLD